MRTLHFAGILCWIFYISAVIRPVYVLFLTLRSLDFSGVERKLVREANLLSMSHQEYVSKVAYMTKELKSCGSTWKSNARLEADLKRDKDLARAWGDALAQNTTIEELIFLDHFNETITPLIMAPLCHALRTNHTIKTITLWRNKIGVEGCALLAGALKLNTSVTALDLSDNDIGDGGCVALADALKQNTSIIYLTLSWELHNEIKSSHFKLNFDYRGFLNKSLMHLREACIAGDAFVARILLSRLVIKCKMSSIACNYCAVAAALINDVELTLECLRCWPEQCSDIIQECSAGAWPMFRQGCLYKRIKEVKSKSLPSHGLCAIQSALAVTAAMKGNSALSVAHVHICGEGHAGKTMTKKALVKCMVNSFVAFDWFALPDVTARTMGMVSKTLELQNSSVRVILNDYGGQQEFHANHAAHLAYPNSVYLLIVPLWDMRPRPKPDEKKPIDEPMDLEELISNYTKWLKFINSVVPTTEHKAQCITILNFFRKFSSRPPRDYDIETVVKRLLRIQKTFRKNSDSKISFINPVIQVDSNLPASVFYSIFPVLKKAIQDLAIAPIPVAPAVQVVLDSKSQWPNFCSARELKNRLAECLQNSKIANATFYPSILSIGDETAVAEVIRTIAEITQGLLEARRDIVVFPVPTGEDVAITKPNWLTEKLLGALFDPSKRKVEAGIADHLLTYEEIVEAATSVQGVSDDSVDKKIFPKLLEHVGACIPVNLIDDVVYVDGSDKYKESEVKHYFPAFSATSIGEENIPNIKDADQVVIREIRLINPELCIFPPGYFSSLFVEIVGKCEQSNLIRLFKDGMVLKFGDGNFQLLIRCNTSETSFTIEAEAKGSTHAAGSAWLVMQQVRALVLKTSSWRRNVAVEEVGVHPNARTGKAISIAYLEEKLQQSGELSTKDLPFYYGINRSDVYASLQKTAYDIIQKVEEVHKRMEEHHEEVMGKFFQIVPMIDKIKDAHVASMEALIIKIEQVATNAKLMQINIKADLIELISSLKSADTGENEGWSVLLTGMVEHTKSIVDSASFTQISQMLDMKDEILKEFSNLTQGLQNATMKKLDQIEENYKKYSSENFEKTRADICAHLTLEVRNIASYISQLGPDISKDIKNSIKRLQGAADLASSTHKNSLNDLHKELVEGRKYLVNALSTQIEALHEQMQDDESRTQDTINVQSSLRKIQATLEAVRSVQDNSVYGLYDVPLLAQLTEIEQKQSILGKFKQSVQTAYRLHFHCPLCGIKVTCGPKGKGYKLVVPKGWVTKVSKVLAISLFALKVISLVTPVPMPHVDVLANYLPDEASFVAVEEAIEFAKRQFVSGENSVQSGSVGEMRRIVETKLNTGGLNNYLEVTQEYVNQVRTLLLEVNESSPPQKTGLIRTICNSTKECAWVCGSCKEEYKAHGNACLGVKMSLA